METDKKGWKKKRNENEKQKETHGTGELYSISETMRNYQVKWRRIERGTRVQDEPRPQR